MNRSMELRQLSLKKIQDKCKARHKYEQDKIQGHRKKEKARANRDWRQSNKLAQWVRASSRSTSSKGGFGGRDRPKQQITGSPSG